MYGFDPVEDQEDDDWKPPVYFGETHKSGFLRGLDHESKYLSGSDKSCLYQHSLDCHGGGYGPEGGRFDFKMKVLKVFKDPTYRKVGKATMIRRLVQSDALGVAVCLNSRLDWVQSTKVNLTTSRGSTKETPAGR